MNDCGVDAWELTKRLATLREKNPNSLSGTVKKALSNPEASSFATLRDIFLCLDVDIEQAVAIAAASAKPAR